MAEGKIDLASIQVKNAKRQAKVLKKKTDKLDELYRLQSNQQSQGDYAQREINFAADMIANQKYIRHLEAITAIKKVHDQD